MKKKSLRFLFHLRQKCVLGRDLEILLPDMEKNLRDFSFPMMERDIATRLDICANWQFESFTISFWLICMYFGTECKLNLAKKTISSQEIPESFLVIETVFVPI